MSTKQLIWQKAVSLQIQGKKVMSCGWWDFFTVPGTDRISLSPSHSPAGSVTLHIIHLTSYSSLEQVIVHSIPSLPAITQAKKNLTQRHTHQKTLILLEIPGVKQVWFDTSETSHHCHSTPPPQSNARLHKTWWGGPSSLPLSPG